MANYCPPGAQPQEGAGIPPNDVAPGEAEQMSVQNVTILPPQIGDRVYIRFDPNYPTSSSKSVAGHFGVVQALQGAPDPSTPGDPAHPTKFAVVYVHSKQVTRTVFTSHLLKALQVQF